MIPVVLAHGALGPFDEIIFIGVAAIFLVLMGVSWVRSRNTPLEIEDENVIPTFTPETPEHTERFTLE